MEGQAQVGIVLTWQTIILAGSVLTALGILIGVFANAVRFVDRQKAQDEELKSLKQHHENDKDELKRELARELLDIKKELGLIVYGLRAVLNGQQEQGCNGPVTEASNKLEKHINQKAHETIGGYFHE